MHMVILESTDIFFSVLYMDFCHFLCVVLPEQWGRVKVEYVQACNVGSVFEVSLRKANHCCCYCPCVN